MDRQYKLGVDLHEQDNLLDGFTFDTVITALYCNERVIDKTAVKKTVKGILDIQLQDLNALIDSNITEIISRAKKGRE